MIEKITQWLKNAVCDNPTVTREQAIALLLFEAATADYQFDELERVKLLEGIGEGLKIGATDAAELLQWASTHSQLSVSLFPFTQYLNHHLADDEKTDFIEMLWRIAFADGRLAKYEEHYIRHIADLLSVPSENFHIAKQRVQIGVKQGKNATNKENV